MNLDATNIHAGKVECPPPGIFSPGWWLCALIQLYRYTISPALVVLFGARSGCRFTPTCSQYAAQAVQEYGAVSGSFLAFKRLCRCHPLGGCGPDPVPRKQILTAVAKRPSTS